jgi:putative SOS response-associated peptidase YedK
VQPLFDHDQPGRHYALFRVVNRYVGNLPPMPGVFPDYPAPVIRNAGSEREMALMRWGMHSSENCAIA